MARYDLIEKSVEPMTANPEAVPADVRDALKRMTERPMGIADYEVDADDIATIRQYIATLSEQLAAAEAREARVRKALAWEIYCRETAGDFDVCDYWSDLSERVQAIYLAKAAALAHQEQP